MYKQPQTAPRVLTGGGGSLGGGEGPGRSTDSSTAGQQAGGDQLGVQVDGTDPHPPASDVWGLQLVAHHGEHAPEAHSLGREHFGRRRREEAGSSGGPTNGSWPKSSKGMKSIAKS